MIFWCMMSKIQLESNNISPMGVPFHRHVAKTLPTSFWKLLFLLFCVCFFVTLNCVNLFQEFLHLQLPFGYCYFECFGMEKMFR